MRALFGVMILSLLFFASAARAAGPDEQYLQIFNTIQEGDVLNAAGQPAAALAKYEAANSALKRFQAANPTWNIRVVYYRLDYLSTKISEISAKTPTPTPPAPPAKPAVEVPGMSAVLSVAVPFARTTNEPAQAPVSNTVAPATVSGESANQIQALQEHIRQIETDKALLEAKLREALAARPAAVDPAELSRAQEQIRNLQKENEVLKVSLEQAKAANGAPALAAAKAALADANKKLAQLTEANAALVAEKDALQARVKTPAPPDAGLKALQEENELLKKQLAGLKNPGAKAAPDEDLNRKLLEAQAQLAVLQSDKEMLRLETIALQNRVKQMAAAAAAQPAPAPFVAASTPDKASAEKIRQLETQRDELQKSLASARAELAGRKPAGEATARVEEMTRELGSLRARIEVLEARRVPYTQEELALLSKPESTMMTAVIHSPSAAKTPAKPPTAEAEAMLNEAGQYIRAGQMDKAEQKYLELLKLDEKNVSILWHLASIQIDVKHLVEAEKNVKGALALEPDNEYGLFVFGRLRFEQDKYDEALEAFSRAAELDPDNSRFQVYLGLTLSEKGLRGPAEAALRKAIQIDPQDAGAHANLAFIYITQNPPLVELAKWHYEKALAAGQPHNAKLEKLLNSTKPPPGP